MTKLKIPVSVLRKIPSLYETEHVDAPDKVFHAKVFDCAGRGTWYIAEYNPEDGLCFGWVKSPLGDDCDEWGYFAMESLASVKNRMGLPLEFDRHFKPTKAGECADYAK